MPHVSLAEENRRRHWRLNRLFTVGLLLTWVLVTFLVPYHARALNFEFFGWPFSFWVAAQGTLLVYLLLVGLYAAVMSRLDRAQDVDEDD